MFLWILDNRRFSFRFTMLPSLSQLRGLSRHIPKHRFKKLSGGKKRSDLPFEDILQDQHPDKVHFNSFVTHRNRIIPWLLALSKHYTSLQNVTLSFTCFDEGGREVNIKANPKKMYTWVIYICHQKDHALIPTMI